MLEHVIFIYIYIYIYICPCDILLFRYPEDPFLASAMKPLTAKSGRVGFGDRYHAGRGISINHCLVLYIYIYM